MWFKLLYGQNTGAKHALNVDSNGHQKNTQKTQKWMFQNNKKT